VSYRTQKVQIYLNGEQSLMEIKKLDKKEAKTLLAKGLPLVPLKDKEMSSVNGGGASAVYVCG